MRLHPLCPGIMPYRKISHGIKLAAIRLYERDILPLPDILDCLCISKRTFYRILISWQDTGDDVTGILSAPVDDLTHSNLMMSNTSKG